MGSGRYVLIIDETAFFDVPGCDIERIERAVADRDDYVEFSSRGGAHRVRVTGVDVGWSERRAPDE